MDIRKRIKNIWDEIGFLEGIHAKNKKFSNFHRYRSIEEAILAFEQSKIKLFDINKWSSLPGISSAFYLHDTNGESTQEEKPKKGYHIYIDLPGPDPVNWVQIIDVSELQTIAEFTVRPSADPRAEISDQTEIKHFFTDKATSTFRVRRSGKTIYAYQIGKQEEINNSGKKAGSRKVINTIIAETGSLGLQKLQWEKLTNYLVHNQENV
ncbi:hypothetical protein [Anditalea andensis]|uniref:Uncharacterized protein n=1 Tax=Anditalea andensis TaxID=1048983 RepID=A0A074KUV0_9BACT|nr:hypothetical protein [Anditalea andensis]KEO73751.1 hypothetical protein EL17_09550 [Anditalea andensis]